LAAITPDSFTAVHRAFVKPCVPPNKINPWNCPGVGGTQMPVDSFDVGPRPSEPGGVPAVREIGTPRKLCKFGVFSVSRYSKGRVWALARFMAHPAKITGKARLKMACNLMG
jgi:hypothetical protein